MPTALTASTGNPEAYLQFWSSEIPAPTGLNVRIQRRIKLFVIVAWSPIRFKSALASSRCKFAEPLDRPGPGSSTSRFTRHSTVAVRRTGTHALEQSQYRPHLIVLPIAATMCISDVPGFVKDSTPCLIRLFSRLSAPFIDDSLIIYPVLKMSRVYSSCCRLVGEFQRGEFPSFG